MTLSYISMKQGGTTRKCEEPDQECCVEEKRMPDMVCGVQKRGIEEVLEEWAMKKESPNVGLMRANKD